MEKGYGIFSFLPHFKVFKTELCLTLDSNFYLLLVRQKLILSLLTTQKPQNLQNGLEENPMTLQSLSFYFLRNNCYTVTLTSSVSFPKGIKRRLPSWVWWHKPVISAMGKLRQEDHF